MLQWLPGSASEVIWNERAGDRYVARIADTATLNPELLSFLICSPLKISPAATVARR